MIDLNNIRILLITAGVSQLVINFDNEQKLVNAKYVFRGVPGTKKITYQEIIDSFSIGQSEAPVGPGAAIAQELL